MLQKKSRVSYEAGCVMVIERGKTIYYRGSGLELTGSPIGIRGISRDRVFTAGFLAERGGKLAAGYKNKAHQLRGRIHKHPTVLGYRDPMR